MPQKYIKRKTKPVATYGETGEENKIQWITKSVGTFTGGGGGGTGTVDTEMSDTSTNAVQNKVIKEYVDKADENLTKVMPTDINVDANKYLILEHDGVEITGQKKKLKYPFVYNSDINTLETNTILRINNILHATDGIFDGALESYQDNSLTFYVGATSQSASMYISPLFDEIKLTFSYSDGQAINTSVGLDVSVDANILTDKNVNTYITGKLDKSTSKKMAYVNDADGNPAMVEYSLLPGNSNIAQFDTGGHLYTEACVIDTHCANKKYVDDAVASIKTETIKAVEISDVPADATNGTLTDEQLTTLQSYDDNYIMFNHEKYYLQDKGHIEGYLTYTHTGYENNQMWLKSITLTIATKTWVLNVVGVKPTVVLTQSDYDNLAAKDANTLYYIIG